MMRVVQFRFAVFRRTFGREPLPSEPLFFDANSSDPVAVGNDGAVVQLVEAANALELSFSKLREFLNLAKE